MPKIKMLDEAGNVLLEADSAKNTETELYALEPVAEALKTRQLL